MDFSLERRLTLLKWYCNFLEDDYNFDTNPLPIEDNDKTLKTFKKNVMQMIKEKTTKEIERYYEMDLNDN